MPKWQFSKINMPLSQELQHMLRMNLVTLIEPHLNPKTSSPKYNPDARCAYHSNSPGAWYWRLLEVEVQNSRPDWWRSTGIHTRWSTGMFLSILQGSPFEVTSFDKRGFCSLEFSICNFLLIDRIFIHVKLCYFINALHMSVQNQFVRIHYI